MTMTSVSLPTRAHDGGVRIRIHGSTEAPPVQRHVQEGDRRRVRLVAAQSAERGGLLRREGLYTSHLAEWRNAFARKDAAKTPGKKAGGAGRRSNAEKELDRARRRIAKLETELERTKTALEITGKAHALLESISEGADSEASRSRDRRKLRRPREVTAPAAPRCWAGPGPPTTGAPATVLGPPAPRPAPANALSEAERQHILGVLRSAAFCDLAPAQVWARLLDDGIYLCSIATMYRLLAIAGENRERRRQRTHPAKKKPELIATAPNQVWSWDITKLRGPTRGLYYELFVIIDIYSRYVIAWTVAPPRPASWPRSSSTRPSPPRASAGQLTCTPIGARR